MSDDHGFNGDIAFSSSSFNWDGTPVLHSITEDAELLESVLIVGLFHLEAGARTLPEFLKMVCRELPRGMNANFHLHAVYFALGCRFPFRGMDPMTVDQVGDTTFEQLALIHAAAIKILREHENHEFLEQALNSDPPDISEFL